MLPKSESCPICKKPSVAAHQPFCSQGCKDRDLINWIDGAYAAPAPLDEEEADSWEHRRDN